jgi:5-methylcytosine-specific restriction endonuclease McrA
LPIHIFCMKAKVPSKVPALTFTMLDKGYVDLGTELSKALKAGGFFDPSALRQKQADFFEAQYNGRRLQFKVYKPKAKNGAHTRLTLEKDTVKSLSLVAGDALLFDFSVHGGISLKVDRTGHVSGSVAKKLLKLPGSSKPKGRRTIRVHQKPKGKTNPVAGRVAALKYNRCPEVAEWVLGHTHGICEYCKKPAPFIGLNGLPFLETHHILFLAEGGPDIVENVVALCPNCHRECHSSSGAAALARRLRLIVQGRDWD